jgi:hypothetical protein
MRAAVADFADAVIGRRAESAITSQNRLYRLIKDGFGGSVPSETDVSRIFGITERRAASALATISNRYRPDFERGWIAAAETAFNQHRETVENNPDASQFTAPRVVITYLNGITATLRDGRLRRIQPVSGTAGRYEIKQDTLEALCQALNITLAPLA